MDVRLFVDGVVFSLSSQVRTHTYIALHCMTWHDVGQLRMLLHAPTLKTHIACTSHHDMKQQGVAFQKKPDEGRMKGLAFLKDPDGVCVWCGSMSFLSLSLLHVGVGVGVGMRENACVRAFCGRSRDPMHTTHKQATGSRSSAATPPPSAPAIPPPTPLPRPCCG